MTRRTHLPAGLAALLVSAAVSGAGPTFESLDRNGDNMISRPEAHADDKVDNHFRGLDSDGDGDLDRGEFARFEAGERPATEEATRVPGDPRVGPEPPNLPPTR